MKKYFYKKFRFFLIWFLFIFLISCAKNDENQEITFVVPEVSYSGLTTEQISTLDNFLKEYEKELRASHEKFSEEIIKQALAVKKREEVQKFLIQ